MRKLGLIVLSLLATSCVSTGQVAPPTSCPATPPLPPNLSDRTDYVEPICERFFDSSDGCRPSGTD